MTHRPRGGAHHATAVTIVPSKIWTMVSAGTYDVISMIHRCHRSGDVEADVKGDVEALGDSVAT
ncbi:hypothetical protein [Streptosporangium sp. NPDC023615]|uniref:hypothetical protein n=1 Tax=Streptosporangium sp. NPDC023615 TaxID=3154794 RepID=UPI00342C77FD